MTPRKPVFMIIAFIAGITILSLSSCSNKFYAKQCERRFPVVENTKQIIIEKQGKTDTLMQSVTIDCDSAIKYLQDTAHTSHLVRVPCPPSYYRVDTFSNTITIIRKDSAGNYLTSLELSKLRQRTADQAEKISKQARIIRKFTLGLILAGLAGLILLVLKLYLKFKL